MRMIETTSPAKTSWSFAKDGPPLLAVALVFAFVVSLAVGPSQPILAAGVLGLLLFLVTCFEFMAWLRQTRVDRLAADHHADTLEQRLRTAHKRRLQDYWF